jgi:hypothetical protein
MHLFLCWTLEKNNGFQKVLESVVNKVTNCSLEIEVYFLVVPSNLLQPLWLNYFLDLHDLPAMKTLPGIKRFYCEAGDVPLWYAT